MGFMAGFGPAFADAFNASTERSQKRADDDFKMAYQRLLANDKERKEMTTKSGYAVTRAEAIAAAKGIPPEAVPGLADLILSGAGQSEIDNYASGSFEVTNTKDGAKVGEKITPASATMPVDSRDQQTQDAFQKGVQDKVAVDKQVPMAGTGAPKEGSFPAQPTQAAQAQPQTPVLSPEMTRRRDAAYRRLAQQEGVTLDEIKRRMESPASSANAIDRLRNPNLSVKYVPKPPEIKSLVDNTVEEAALRLAQVKRRGGTPEEIAEAEENLNILRSVRAEEFITKANAEAGVYNEGGAPMNIFSPDGKYLRTEVVRREPDGRGGFININNAGQQIPDGIARPISPNEQQARQRITASLEQPLQELGKKQAAAKGLIRTSGILINLVENNPNVLLDWQPSLERWFDKYGREVGALLESVAKTNNAGQVVTDPAEISRLQGFVNSFKDDSSSEGQKALFEAQRAIAAYQYAGIFGQKGSGVSNADVERFLANTKGGTSVNTFYNAISNMTIPSIRNIDTEGYDIYNNNQELRSFETQRGFKPKEYTYIPLEENLKTVEGKDPNNPNTDLATIYSKLLANSEYKNTTAPKDIQKQPENKPKSEYPVYNSKEEVIKDLKSGKLKPTDLILSRPDGVPFSAGNVK